METIPVAITSANVPALTGHDEAAIPTVAGEAGEHMADDLLAGGVLLLDGRVGDRLEQLAVEVLEQQHVLQEFDVVGSHEARA